MQGALLTGVVVRRWSQSVPAPWRNGGGVTRELLRDPPQGEPFDWRISVAEVAFDGPFSSFPGYERVLVLLSGDGMVLHRRDDGSTVRLDSVGASHRFAGEHSIDATLTRVPTTDFNLMWRRGVVDAHVEDVFVDGATNLGDLTHTTAVFVMDGAVRIDGNELEPGDLASWSGGERCEGAARLLVCSLRPATA